MSYKDMRRYLQYCLLVLMAISCRQKVDPPGNVPPSGYLVVEGVINSGVGPTTITLSRTTRIDTSFINYERGARITVEDSLNNRFFLTELSAGKYTAFQLSLSPNQKYRLHILTSDGREYASDYIAVKNTPPIDSVEWQQLNGVTIFMNTHDPKNNTRYYRWEYDETWEYHSSFHSELKYVTNPFGHILDVAFWDTIYHSYDSTIFKCWQSDHSTSILIGTSAKLVRDTIHLPILNIEQDSWKLSQLYSVNVRQYALTEDEYNFYQKMKKNTDQTGTIFDAQPSELKGNIHCITHPSEPVIGYMAVTNPSVSRIFIDHGQVPGWNYQANCQPEMPLDNNPDTLNKYSYLYPTISTKVTSDGKHVLTLFAADEICVVCTARGGTNVKPSFWPR